MARIRASVSTLPATTGAALTVVLLPFPARIGLGAERVPVAAAVRRGVVFLFFAGLVTVFLDLAGVAGLDPAAADFVGLALAAPTRGFAGWDLAAAVLDFAALGLAVVAVRVLDAADFGFAAARRDAAAGLLRALAADLAGFFAVATLALRLALRAPPAEVVLALGLGAAFAVLVVFAAGFFIVGFNCGLNRPKK